MAVKGSDANYETGASTAAGKAATTETGKVNLDDEVRRAMNLPRNNWTGTKWEVTVPQCQPRGGVGDGE